MNTNMSDDQKRLADALEGLADHRFVRIHDSTLRMVWFQFLRGLAFGFGSAVGASLLVSIVIYIVSQFEFLPIIGDWAAQLVDYIEIQLQ